eukprot:9262464-Pyramimonas_sp.AAC.1
MGDGRDTPQRDTLLCHTSVSLRVQVKPGLTSRPFLSHCARRLAHHLAALPVARPSGARRRSPAFGHTGRTPSPPDPLSAHQALTPAHAQGARPPPTRDEPRPGSTTMVQPSSACPPRDPSRSAWGDRPTDHPPVLGQGKVLSLGNINIRVRDKRSRSVTPLLSTQKLRYSGVVVTWEQLRYPG